MTDAWGANTLHVRKQLPNPHFQKYADPRPFSFWFFRRFPRINVCGHSTRFPSMEDAPLAHLRGPFCGPHQRASCDRDHFQNGTVDLQFVTINDQLVVIFTKPLIEERLILLRSQLGMIFVIY